MDISFALAILKKQSMYVEMVSKHFVKSGKLQLWLDWIKCFILYGATPSDWFVYSMYLLSPRECRNIITRRKNLELDGLFNPRIYKSLFDDKVKFNREYKDFIKREWIYTKEYTKEEIVCFVNKIKNIVVKPIDLSSGRGVFLFDADKEKLDVLMSKIEGKAFLLEEKIELITELKILNPPSCNTLRIYTLVMNNGDVIIIDAVLRVGGGDHICDNFHSKGVVYPVDICTGIITGKGKDILLNEYLFHPSTKIVMPGYQIPCWQNILDFSKKAALHNPKARFIGWDIALKEEGCEMIEGNYYVYCGLLQIFDKRGKYNFLKRYL